MSRVTNNMDQKEKQTQQLPPWLAKARLLYNMLESGFAQATITKVLTFVSIASLFVADVGARFGLPSQYDVGESAQLWRFLTSQLVCARTDGALICATALYNLRQIERQMGTSKFAGFVVLINTVSVFIQAQIVSFFPKSFVGPAGFSPGPYALVFALAVLYWTRVPRRRRVVNTRLFGVLMTEKSVPYFFVLLCILNGGLSTVLPAASALLPTALYLSEVCDTFLYVGLHCLVTLGLRLCVLLLSAPGCSHKIYSLAGIHQPDLPQCGWAVAVNSNDQSNCWQPWASPS